ncbi:MAG: phosphoribosylformylglycinamidine synthase [Porphyromonas sp.]|nr:phosphoribosylformylglycinamidine synthase [Porphyromonas sp.]
MKKMTFYRGSDRQIFAVRHTQPITGDDAAALTWLFDGARQVEAETLTGYYIGPRAEMITPWSTTAVEITRNMGIGNRLGIDRIEFFVPAEADTVFDRMLLRKYEGLSATVFSDTREPEKIIEVQDLRAYNDAEGLALSEEEVEYLEGVARELGRPLTDSELFGFSQVNSEHCRHKIFGGTFVIDGEEKERSLFAMIKETSAEHPNNLVSAYKDNVAFNKGPEVEIFAPKSAAAPDFFRTKSVPSVLSLKAETHNFPTTVEPFNGAATGSGGEIRDRLAGGRASMPLAGTAVYMTPYTRRGGHPWEKEITARPWLYQTPQELLTKASNGASDFGNKYGQPLINGSLLTFEHQEQGDTWGYDKVIMLAGGIGYATERDALKGEAVPGDKIVVMGGDNYRIGMGGGAVSSVNTGQYEDAIELNAIQRSNPEMQKRVANVIRALAEGDINPIVSIHDHGAGGHLNCLSELVETQGGKIYMDQLPVGDPSLSAKELISNESQERMGLLVKPGDIDGLRKIAEREKAPFYVVGEATGDMELTFEQKDGVKPFDLKLQHLFGSAPKTVMTDHTLTRHFSDPEATLLSAQRFKENLRNVLALESVGSKDWLTNKVDRSVSGKVARQQTLGPLQVPVSDLGAVALDYQGKAGIATAIGHAPQVALADAPAGSRVAIAEALTNLIGAPLKEGLKSVSLSANWMWPCRNEGENARLYNAVEAASDFAKALGVNIPTGKDSLSMTQKYPDGKKVLAPGTLIVSAAGEVSDVKDIVGPAWYGKGKIYKVDFSSTAPTLGGSALYQTLGKVGAQVPDIADPDYFKRAYDAVQSMIANRLVTALHDISAGGVITALIEMMLANGRGGLTLQQPDQELAQSLFVENCGLLLFTSDSTAFEGFLNEKSIRYQLMAETTDTPLLNIKSQDLDVQWTQQELLDQWSVATDSLEPFQTRAEEASLRVKNRGKQPLKFEFTNTLNTARPVIDADRKGGITAAIIRDKGTNGEREMAYALYLAGFDVKDVHMTDLMTGRETLDDVRLIVFCGGFSHSDVLGSAKGWAAGFKFNDLAQQALSRFYARPDTLSLGICNGCQLMSELELLYPEHEEKHRMTHNASGKFESAFVSLTIPENNSVFLKSLAGTTMGCWVAHGEGRFSLPYTQDKYNIVATYSYDEYPANPNGSVGAIAALSNADGRHLAMMPHPERSIFPWQCAYYPEDRQDEVTPWFSMFTNAYDWLSK